MRDERLRASFKVHAYVHNSDLTVWSPGSQTICWLNLSQQPEIMRLQAQLYSQLHPDNEEIPTKAQKSPENQLRELRKVAEKRLILVVLDGGS